MPHIRSQINIPISENKLHLKNNTAMRKLSTISLFFIFLSCLSFTGIQKAYAKKFPVQSNRIWNTDIQDSGIVAASLPDNCTLIASMLNSSIISQERISNRIVFGVTPSCPPAPMPCYSYQTESYMIELDLTITFDKLVLVPGPSPYYQCTQEVRDICMYIEYRKDGLYIDKSVYEFEGATNIQVLINDTIIRTASGTVPPMNIYLDVELEEERIYNFTPGSSTITVNSPVYISADGELEISWQQVNWAEEYQLEWVYVDNYNVANISNTPFEESEFRFNSTRVSTVATSYRIPLVYGKGALIYRVRGLGNPSPNSLISLYPGAWCPAPTGGQNKIIGDFAHYVIGNTEKHEDFLNWQFTASYAEEGKSKVSVNYFDGSLRSRQMVTKAKTDNTTVVGETIYDHQGRAAINILPVPSFDTKIKYHPLFNVNMSNAPYNRVNFDLDNQQEYCTASPDSLKSTSGAARYYSFQRLSSGNLSFADNYLPESFGFPFTQTVFTPDNTGRIRSQSGAGKELKIGSGKETKYFYGKPFQEELDQLFGLESGDALHYKKNMVFDPNGQVSISYLDPSGKVVATSLTGALPSNVSALSPLPSSDYLSFDLLNKTRPTDNSGSENMLDLTSATRKVSRELLLDKDGIRSFGYSLTGNKFSITCPGNTPNPVCYDCVLDLEVSLKDECGTEVLSGINPAGGSNYTLGSSIVASVDEYYKNGTPFNPLVGCGTSNLSFSRGLSGSPIGIDQTWATLSSLKKGSYTLNKILKVNSKALDYYTKNYLSSACLTPYSSFLSQELAKIDLTDCDNELTCSTCSTLVGNREQYQNPANDNTDCNGKPCLTDEQYNMLLQQCADLCEGVGCKSLLASMKADMTLHGQYGEVSAQPIIVNGAVQPGPQTTAYNPYLYPLSVYNEANFLPVRSVKGVVRFPNWRFPYDGAYKNAGGQISYVQVTKNIDNGTYSPAILPGVANKLIVVNEEENLFKIQPQYLLKVQDFIKNWNPSWVNSLVPYHPEYGYYLFCKQLEATGSNGYDDELMNVDTYEKAVDIGLTEAFLPLGPILSSTGCISPNPQLVVNDPLFASILVTADDKRAMQNAMCNYTLIPVSGSISIWELAYKLAYCPKSVLPTPNTACATCTMPYTTHNGNQVPDFSGAHEDKAWQIYRALYISLKQRFTEKKAAAAAILVTNSYSECIGNPNFDPARYNFSKAGTYTPPVSGWMYGAPFNFPNFSPSPGSQFFNFEQPCNWSRYYLYQNKTPRYQGASSAYDLVQSVKDLTESPNGAKYVNGTGQQANDGLRMSADASQELLTRNENLTDITLYQRCEKCPMAQDLELLLNAMLKNRTCSLVSDLSNQSGCVSNKVPIGCNNATASYEELTDDLENLIGGAVGTGKLKWKVDDLTYNSGNLYWHLRGSFFVDGLENAVCSLELRMPNGTQQQYDFTSITSFCCLKYLPSPQYLTTVQNKNFQITAIIPDASSPSGYKEIILEGVTSCINVTACTFEPVCTPSQEANDMLSLFNTLVIYNHPSCSTTFNVLNAVACSTDLTDRLQPFSTGFTSLLRYVTDSKICTDKVQLNEAWQWETVSATGGELIGRIFASNQSCSINNIAPDCRIRLGFPAASTYNFTHIVKFTNIRPDPSNQEGSFLMDALVDDGTNREYITLSGSAPCYNFGTCVTDMPGSIRMASPLPRKLNCKRSASGDELFALLKEADAYRISSMNGPILSTKPGTSDPVCNNDGQCLQDIRDDLDVIEDYLNTLYQIENYYNPGSGLCAEDVKLYTFYNNTGQPLLDGCILAGDTFKLMWGPCCSLSINLNSKCQAVLEVLCVQYLNGRIVYSNWWSRTLCTTCVAPSDPPGPGTCGIEFEPLPEGSGYSFADVRDIEDLQPDPDRPTPGQGYFIAYLKMKDGNVVAVKGYNNCMPIGECTDCTTDELIGNGDFSLGNSSFTSDYAHTTFTLNGGCPDIDLFIIEESSNCNGTNPAITDHTTNTRLFSSTPQQGFLLLGGSSTTGNKTAWQNMYNVVKGQEYTFTLFYLNGNASQTSMPENYIHVQLNGVTVNREKVKFIPGRLWQELTVKWIADDDEVVIKIINEVNHTDNIVAIDDISLRSFCACNDVPLAVNNNFDNYDYGINYTDVPLALQLNNATPHYLLPLPPNPIPPGLPNAAMQYNIFKFYGTAPAILKDHNRPRKGSFMVFKLNNIANQAVVWRQIINVTPFTEFNFSAWFSAQQANTMMVEMYVNGTLVTKASNDATVAPDWFVLGGRWTSGNANQAELVIKVINTGNDLHFFAVDDIVFRRNCQGNCEEKRVTEVSFDSPEDNCIEHLTNIAHHNARIRYDEYISGIEDDFREQYIAKCLDVYEDFYMREQDNGHHFTLYYYDQSGQLIRTVPPKGFTKITSDDELKRIRIDRANGKRTVFTNHSMTTTYAYNSLNQLMQQSVPDNDDMEIWDVHEYGTNHTASSGLNASAFANNFVGSATGVHATNTSLGGLFKTSNSGKTWTPIDKVATGKPKALQLVDGSNDVFMLTSDQKLLHSIDNGEKWEITNVLPIGKNYIGMHFTTATVGMIADDEGNVYNYTIAVPSWTLSATESIPVTGTDRVRLVHMFDANYGFALTVEGKIINTTDGWASIGIDYKVRSVGLNKVEMFDANVGHAVGKDGTLLCTENAGDSWKEIPSKLTANLINVHFRSHTTGCALDDAGNLYATTNKGVEWNKIEDPISSSDKIAAFDFHSKQVGLSITKKGKLFGTVNGGVNWIKLQEAEPALDGTSNYFNTLDMISATEAFATDYSNKVYYIKFILNQWYISTCSACSLALPTNVKATKIQFIDLVDGTVLGSDNILYHFDITGISTITDDVPVTSFTISSPLDDITPANNLLSDIRYVAPNKYYALSKDGEVHETIDQGVIWTSLAQVSGTGYEFSSIAIEPTSNSKAIIVGTTGEIFISGTTGWNLLDKSNTVTPPTINAMHTVKVSSTSVIHTYAVGDDGTVLYRNSTTDIWNTLTTGTSNNLHAVAFKKNDENNGIISGENGFAAVTVNAGTSWSTADFYTATLSGDPTKEVPHTQADYTAALAISTTEFYVAGTEGWMFKYTIGVNPTPDLLEYHDPKTTQDIVLMTGDGTNQLLAGHQADVSYFDPTPPDPKWLPAKTLLPSVLHDMHLMSNNVGYAVGNNGNIIKTTNGGQSWTSIFSPTSGQLKAVDFVDELNGYIAGNNGIIYRTTNGGISWTNCSTHVNTANHIYDIHLVDANLAFICGANNTVYYSRNPFIISPTWTSFSSPVSGANLNAIHTVDGAVGYAVGDNDVMLKFELNLANNIYSWKPRLLLNSVTPWIEHHTPTSGVNITDVKFRDHKTGYVIAANGALLKTTDAGETWTLEKTNSAATPLYNSVNYRHLCLVDDHHLFLSGDGSNTKNFLYLYDQKHEFSSRFYYDKLGRLVVSQNAEQYARGLAQSKNIYSYTTYDFKGRITEVGEVAATTEIETLYNNNTVLEGNRMNETDYLNWLGANTRTQVTKTYYDYQAISPAGSPVTVNSSFNAYTALPDHEYTATFDNLRSRVSAITYENTHDGVDNTYQYAVFYSYDVHGNVKTIFNEANIDLGNSPNNRYVLKQVDYEYDLVSGKVNRVVLNPWKKDKFIHRYEYDADNRITQVFTSHDGVIWQNDARYQYYKHGPLARTELGSDNVQGLDYAYTMQGWLKGVNSNTLVDNERDMGKDGFRNVSNPNANFAPDEFGFALNYFNGDYAAINSPVPTKHFMAEMPVASNLSAANVDLFNGNISHMVTAIRQFMLGDGPGKKPQAMVYNYDQLNRLKATHKLQNVNLVNNQWNTNIDLDDDYTETYTYDANGNILTLKRKGISNCSSPASNEIDDLVYKYEYRANDNLYTRKTNRLRAVLDAVGHTVAPGTNDIKDQPWHTPKPNPSNLPPDPQYDNYQYDRLGNLIKDVQEEIASIEWTTYGKIKSITRTQNSLKPDLEFAYDPSGNRVLKIVKPHDPGGTGVMGQQYWKYTYYVRDAQGNTLANYNHFGDRPYEAESYLLYGSSRIGEYVPRKYTNSCGENIDVTMWANWEDAGNWAQAYLHRLGYDVSYQTYWYDQWKNIGYDFNSITSPKALQALANAWMEWMCSTRCLRYGQMSSEYTAAFDEFWSLRLGEASAAGGFTDFSATYMHNLENYVWPSGFELLSSLFECDDCNRFTYAKGSRHFELSNHLGNVLVTVSDRKIAVDEEYTYNPAAANRYLRNGSYTASADGDFELINTADGLASEYLAEVISANDYYPFGMIMPGRSYVKPLSCNGSENCTHPEQILMDGHTQSWQNYGSANSVYNSTEDRQEITMNAPNSGAEFTVNGTPTGNEITTVSMVVQAGTYNDVTVEVYDMGNTLVPGMQQVVMAGHNRSRCV
jgi:photosystem II stability/assembly factor-like uncharacterized protein